jgi:hypothetical protein
MHPGTLLARSWHARLPDAPVDTQHRTSPPDAPLRFSETVAPCFFGPRREAGVPCCQSRRAAVDIVSSKKTWGSPPPLSRRPPEPSACFSCAAVHPAHCPLPTAHCLASAVGPCVAREAPPPALVGPGPRRACPCRSHLIYPPSCRLHRGHVSTAWPLDGD